MPSSVYACILVCLIAIVVLAVATYLMVRDYLTAIKNRLLEINNHVRPIDNSITNVWGTILRIRDDTAKMTGFLDKGEEVTEEPKEDLDISEGGWTLAPCPGCGGTAYMDYNLPAGDGYCVMCGKHTKEYEHCDFGTVAGGPTRLSAATAWNRAVLEHFRCKGEVKADES